MALIQTTPPEKAEGKLAELYAEVEQMFGRVPNNARMLGVSPALLENQLQLMEYYMGHPTLSTPFLAMVRMLVSKACRSWLLPEPQFRAPLEIGFHKGTDSSHADRSRTGASG